MNQWITKDNLAVAEPMGFTITLRDLPRREINQLIDQCITQEHLTHHSCPCLHVLPGFTTPDDHIPDLTEIRFESNPDARQRYRQIEYWQAPVQALTRTMLPQEILLRHLQQQALKQLAEPGLAWRSENNRAILTSGSLLITIRRSTIRQLREETTLDRNNAWRLNNPGAPQTYPSVIGSGIPIFVVKIINQGMPMLICYTTQESSRTTPLDFASQWDSPAGMLADLLSQPWNYGQLAPGENAGVRF